MKKVMGKIGNIFDIVWILGLFPILLIISCLGLLDDFLKEKGLLIGKKLSIIPATALLTISIVYYGIGFFGEDLKELLSEK